MAAQLHFGTGDSVTFGTLGTGTTTTATFSKTSLSNIVIGDLLVAWIHNQSSATGTTTPPSGWTHYGSAAGVPNWSTSRNSGIYYYTVKSQTDIDNLASTVTWTFSITGGRVACIVARATGIDLDNVEDSAATNFSGSSNASSFAISGITTTTTTTLLVGVLYHGNSASTMSPNTTAFMTAFQEYKTAPDGSPLANSGATLGYQYLTSAGATGTITATYDNSVGTMGGELVAFKAGTWTPPPSSTRPAIVGTPTTFISSSAVTSFAINKPTGLQDGDVLILALSAQSQTTTADFSSSGWTRISQPFVANSNANRVIAFYALPVPMAASVSQSSFTFTPTDSATGGRLAAEMFIVRHADLNNLTVATSPYGTTASQTITVQPGSPSVTDNLLLVAYNANFTSGIDYTIASGPSGMVQQTSLITSTAAVSKTALAVYQQNVELGSISTKSLTWNGAQSQTSGVAVVIKSSSSTLPNASGNGLSIKYTSAINTLSTGKLYFTSATNTLATPLEVRPFPTGYTSVDGMLATSPFYVAHRGGSANWPEMSLHAYTQSAFWGVGALELSLARTSDGVWFGMHDASLDRTSLGTGGGSGTTLIASAMTWAQVQSYQIAYGSISNTASFPKPYMRWEELIAAYYGTHVIFVDPKVASGYTAELLNMMDALPSSTTRLVAKYYGVNGNTANTTGWAHDARARGYKTWGYFYQSDSTNFATYQGRWDILGMDYSADQATWTTILSYGKPVIAHTIASSAAATTALNYGAAGMMVSGVQEAVPRTP